MNEKDHATIGDALIFIAKVMGILSAVLIMLAVAGAGVLWWENRASVRLATEKEIALNQVDLLKRQTDALRVQLAALEQALDLERQKVDEQQITIEDLGHKLNLALAGKVEADLLLKRQSNP